MEFKEVSLPVNPTISLSIKSSSVTHKPSSDFKKSIENVTFCPEELSKESLFLEPDSQIPITPEDENTDFHLTVPPATPAARYSFFYSYNSISRNFPNFEEVKFPYIREVGIKSCLEILSGYFNCEDYKLNPIQFWFLDVLTDCLWKIQDEFQFPEQYQKIIIEWILCAMDLIRDPKKNLSRREFFQIFNEAMIVTNEKVQTGCEFLPSPRDLFSLVEDESEDVISFPSTPTSEENSSVSLTSRQTDRESYIVVGIDENSEIFKLPKSPPKYYKHVVSIDNSKAEEEEMVQEEETYTPSELESIEFYQADPNTPDRFRSSSSSSFESIPGENDFKPITEERFLWKRASLPLKMTCSDDIFINNEPSTVFFQRTEENLLSSESNITQTSNNKGIREEWTNYLENRQEYVDGMEKNILINSCALFAIKQFVYDYFYETFQFTVAKFALINTFSSITQNINTKWFVPKVLKEELKRPKPKKEKKKKKKDKAKKPKKKTKARKDKKKKKSKKTKSKKGKKKGKKEKKKKLTKAEKEELARLKREQLRLDEELRKAEENRRLLFPLKEATTDEFFMSIFEKWVKPKEKKKKKSKGKKGKRKK